MSWMFSYEKVLIKKLEINIPLVCINKLTTAILVLAIFKYFEVINNVK